MTQKTVKIHCGAWHIPLLAAEKILFDRDSTLVITCINWVVDFSWIPGGVNVNITYSPLKIDRPGTYPALNMTISYAHSTQHKPFHTKPASTSALWRLIASATLRINLQRIVKIRGHVWTQT